MASGKFSTLEELQRLKAKKIEEEWGGKASAQFVADVKGTALFQCSWGELLSAAPTALSLMGSCWIAASQEGADQVTLTSAVPQGGFRNLPNRSNPTLRACLVDLCNLGGYKAFKKAGTNMDKLAIRSSDIFENKIPMVLKLLGPCTKSKRDLEDFNDSLNALSADSAHCAALVGEVQQAFGTWALMVVELNGALEQKSGTVSVEMSKNQAAKQQALVTETFAKQDKEAADAFVKTAQTKLDKAEQRLDDFTKRIPGPWETCIMTAVNSYAQAMPNIIAGALPALLQMSNPGAAAGSALAGAVRQLNTPQPTGVQTTPNGSQGNYAPQQAQQDYNAAQSSLQDPAYQVAILLTPLLNFFYSYLGGDRGKIDWKMFNDKPSTEEDEPKSESAHGITWLMANITNQRERAELTASRPSQDLDAAFEKALEVAECIKSEMENASDISTEDVDPKVIEGWRKKVKSARDVCIRLETAVKSSGGTQNTPNAFANMKVDVPKADFSTQNASLNAAMQAVQMSQQALDDAQARFDLATERQAKMAAAMARVQITLAELANTGKTLANIKVVLRDCIAVLLDLGIQIRKLEDFFTCLGSLVTELIQPRCNSFKTDLGKAGQRAFADGALTLNNLTKQNIFTATLQLKAYFSLLNDIAVMYSLVHRNHIKKGMDLCDELAKAASSKDLSGPAQANLSAYTQEASDAVNELVNEKKEGILKDLRARALRAAEETRLLEEKLGVQADESAKAAIKDAGKKAVADAKKQVMTIQSATEVVKGMASEEANNTPNDKTAGETEDGEDVDASNI